MQESLTKAGRQSAVSVSLNAGQLGEAFPFHLAFNDQLVIIQTGRTVPKLFGREMTGQSMADHFKIITPSVSFNMKEIEEQAFSVFFLEYLHQKITLKGQMLKSEAQEKPCMIFLCSPAVRDSAAVSELGLSLKDFAIHDSAIDLLVLLQTKTNTLNDVRKMADRLKQEVGVRHQAEQQLKILNEELEQKVAERTRELEIANHGLTHEMAEREKADELVRLKNLELRAWVKRLERYNQQGAMLNKLGDMLQACCSVEETYSVIGDSIRQLFPENAGMFSILRDEEDVFEVVNGWGGLEDRFGQTYARNDCWALRRSKNHIHTAGSDAPPCQHLPQPVLEDYQCIPLTAQGKIIGVLHLHGISGNVMPDEFADAEAKETKRQMIQTAAEHISLSIANLRLQEFLRQQTIRDALTGLYNRRHMEESLEREASRARRSGKPLSIIMLDVDHFKKFNDTKGHAAGDALLRGLGAFLKLQVRGEDIACRYGGEEFILILPGCPKTDAMRRAKQICSDVAEHLRVEHDGENLGKVTISLGVACFPEHAATAGESVAMADCALYASKQNGRNRATLYTAGMI